MIAAQEDERRRLARELHDDASQRLALIEMEVDRLSHLPVSEEIHSGLERIRRQTDSLSIHLRDLSHKLHPSALVHLGLAVALLNLVDQYRKQNLDISFSSREVRDSVPVELATALYRIAQEALRNALKHAPEAPVHVQLTEEADELHLEIQDAGPGFDLPEVRGAGGGLGLLSMRERARLAGGTLLVTTHPGEGTTLHVRLPLDKLGGSDR